MADEIQGTLWAPGNPRRIRVGARRSNFETALGRRVEAQLELAAREGLLVWFGRANAGAAWTGQRLRVRRGQVLDASGQTVDLDGVEVIAGPRWIRLLPKGTPDFIGCTAAGAFFGVELKVGNRPATPEQLATAEAINRTYAGRVMTLTEADAIEKEVVEWLRWFVASDEAHRHSERGGSR